jgi:putative toxin-antitoxin system antitoxin component (TIGR02293 family)
LILFLILITIFAYFTVQFILSMENLLAISHDPVTLIMRAKAGVLKSELVELQKQTGLTNEELADALQISLRALLGYEADEVLKTRISERVLAIAQLYARGFEVWKEKKRFLRWMDQELIVFGGKKGKDLLDTHFGINLLLDELSRIEYGVLA